MSEFMLPDEQLKARPIEAERQFEFEEFGLKGEWLKLSSEDGKSVEGALYKTENGNGEVVVFHPGLPGGGIVRFEEVFVGDLLKAGYDVFAARHNGLKSQEDNNQLLHNQQKANQDTGTSGDAFSWFNEPEVTMSYFAQENQPVTLITHSFSGIMAANSFVEMASRGDDSNPARNVKKWIMPSASIWELREDGMLDPDRGLDVNAMGRYCDYFATKYEIPGEDGSAALLEKIKAILNRINSEIGTSLPETVEVIGIYPTSDKLLSPKIGEAFIDKLPRGALIRDNYVPSRENEDPHDFEHSEATDLLRIMDMKTSMTKHVVEVNKQA